MMAATPNDVRFANDVCLTAHWANIASLRNGVEQYHFERSEKHHIAVGDAPFKTQGNAATSLPKLSPQFAAKPCNLPDFMIYQSQKGGGDMEKQTKNIITCEWIKKELRFYNTADIKSRLVLCGIFTVIFLPITIALIYGILMSFDNVLVKIVLSIFMGGITSSPIWLFFLLIQNALCERKMLARGDFDIVTCDVSYKSEEMVHRHMEEYLYFSGFNKKSVGHTTFQLTSAGDTFYIVHYKDKKDIKLFYSTKMYELQ